MRRSWRLEIRLAALHAEMHPSGSCRYSDVTARVPHSAVLFQLPQRTHHLTAVHIWREYTTELELTCGDSDNPS